jgi:hypothetical protein
MQTLDSATMYSATFLDRDSQPVSNGRARFYTSDGHGVFWPQDGADEDRILKTATSVKTSEGHQLDIRDVKRCPAQFPPERHYDFEFDAVV